MPIQTYRDRLTGKIVAYDPVTNTEKYLGPQEYKEKVAGGVVSGNPVDYSLLQQAKTQQPSSSTAGSTSSGLQSLDKMNRLKAAANEIILMVQNRNKDLTDAGQYWRRMASDTSAFGTKDTSIPTVQQTPESYRLLNPTQQASIRAAREASAGAGLKAVEDERLSREKIAGTSLSNLVDMYKETNRKEESDRGYNLDKWYKEQTLARENQADGIGSYYTDNSGNLKPVDKTKVFNIGGVTYDFGPSGPSSIYAKDPEWGTLITKMFKSVPKYEEYKNMSSRYQTSFDKDIARLAGDNSPLIGMGKYIGDASTQAGVSPELVFSIIRHESANGKSSALKTDNNPGGVTWSSNWPANMKGSKRLEGGNYVKFPTLKDGIDRTIKKVADSVTDGANYITSGKNTYTDTQLRNIAKKTGIDLADLKKRSDQELVSLEASLTTDTSGASQFAKTAEGIRIQAMHGLSADELAAAIQIFSNAALTQEQKKEILIQSGLPEGLYTSLLNAFNK